jgi:putative endonuclease
MTNDLVRRVDEHKSGRIAGFASKYRTRRLVYYEETSDVRDALERERYLKGWKRERKVELIESVNPEWEDPSDAWTKHDVL